MSEQKLEIGVSPLILASINKSLPFDISRAVPNLVSDILKNTDLSKIQDSLSAQTRLLGIYKNLLAKSTAPITVWKKSPKGRCEFFMYKRAQIRDKFSKLVASPIEFLVQIQKIVANFFNSKISLFQYAKNGRAQIMYIRGLALSCAPNFTRFGDINLSRSYSGIA